MTLYIRADRVPFKFEGPDAEKLLKDVLTGYVRAENGPGRWWALLTPQGKIIAEGLIGWWQDAFWLDVAAVAAPAFFKRMRMYKLRADVKISPMTDTHCVGWAKETPPDVTLTTHQDSRAEGLGYRIIAQKELAQNWNQDIEVFLVQRISAGIAELGPDFPSESLFPHDIGMDLLDGIDFKKGCYVGQEVVSRMRHRGSARRRPVIVSGIASTSETEISFEGRVLGNIGIVADGCAIAIARLDRIPGDGSALLGPDSVHLAVPPWASYAFGDSGED